MSGARVRTAVLISGRIPDADASQLLPIVQSLDKTLDEVRVKHPGYRISVTGLSAIAARNSADMIKKLNYGLTAEIVFVGEDVVLQREEDAGGVDEIDQREAILDGDFLGAENFFGGGGKEGAGFDGGVVGDDHVTAAADRADAGDDAGGRRAAPFGIHAPGGPQIEFEECGIGIDQLIDPLARGEAVFFVLAGDGSLAAAETDIGLLLGELSDDDVLLLGLRIRYRLSQREVAQLLKVHEGTISRRTDHLRDQCLDYLAKQLVEAG